MSARDSKWPQQHFRASQCSRRELLRGALGGVSLGLARRLGLPLLFSQAALGHAAEAECQPHPGRPRAVRRQRRPEHGRALCRRRLLPASAANRHQAKQAAQDRRSLRLQRRHGRLRAALQGRQARDRARLRLRESVVLAFHVDGLLAHRGAQQRRGISAGSAASPMRWIHSRRRTSWSTSTRRSRSPCAAACTRRWSSTIPRSSHATVLRRESRCSTRSPRPVRIDQSHAALPARRRAQRAGMHPRWCARPGRSTARPSTTASCRSHLAKVAALIDAGMPTRLYYVAYRNNAFDTHVHAGGPAPAAADLRLRRGVRLHARHGAHRPRRRRRMMIFSEFGRRVPENTSLGTDHGAANVMFLAGKHVKGGHYGEVPSLDQARRAATTCSTPPTSGASTPRRCRAGWATPIRARCCGASSSRSPCSASKHV